MKNTNTFHRARPGSEATDKVIGASYSYADSLKFEQLSLSPSQTNSSNTSSLPESPVIKPVTSRKTAQFDMDDDWDANVDHDLVRVTSIPKSFENKPIPDYKKPTRPKYLHRHSTGNTNSSLPMSASSKGLKAASNGSSSSLSFMNSASMLSTTKEEQNGDATKEEPKTPVDGLDESKEVEGTDKDLESAISNSSETSSHNNNNGLKAQYQQIMDNPINSLSTLDLTQPSSESLDDTKRFSRIQKFNKILHSPNIDLHELKKLAWSGVPFELRPVTWQILLGYLPTSAERRITTLLRKRKEYLDGVDQVFSSGLDQAMWHQISIDVPRTNPHIPLYGFHSTQRALERILYLWAIRHPASGYVQGINDLATPFFQTFLSAYIETDPEKYDPGQLPKEVLDAVEADTFWCLTKLLDGIQDNYIHAQPGIQRQVAELRELTQRIDANLVKHLSAESIEFMQFSFRWMNCLLMREVSVKNTIRMWDTYISEDAARGFSEFHVYVCAAFLVKWSAQIQEMDFQEIMMFLQALPTKDWGEKDIELLLSEAYMWQSLFKNASAHLR